MTRNENMVAVGLEVAPGLLLQTFGIGHLYSGQVKTGVLIMVSYWCLQALNVMLIPFWIGLITWPLTLLAYMIFAPSNLLGRK